ncbi:hypothetical protein [Microlunatus antarcticus]|uniref:Uncharacterized protein n=1 Tax=Microlunatus antarcticus TaxID=53388 RepID=A0A7W5JUK6_9ACTN|nr:hypothetical protein [Microlunatus antarcticus]MBB3326564.1 hypothetical protein [Microlunatus antarcticus]
MEEWESWQEAGLTLDEWVAHVLGRAADRRELARFQAERGNADAAQLLMRSAVARELYAASLRGEQTAEEVQVVGALLPNWTGSSSEELLAVARDILASPTVNS